MVEAGAVPGIDTLAVQSCLLEVGKRSAVAQVGCMVIDRLAAMAGLLAVDPLAGGELQQVAGMQGTGLLQSGFGM